MEKNNIQHVYIIGSKGIPAKYGGFETFVEKLTEYKEVPNIQYHVSCMRENSIKSGIYNDRFNYNSADCFNIKVPNIGPAKAIYYDFFALNKAIMISEQNKDKSPVFYVLACRIGPFISYFKKRIEKLNGKLHVNPDGHEWKRTKWSKPVRLYWKNSERLMVKYADLLVCDSLKIEEYIQLEYKMYEPRTRYIAYGTDLAQTQLNKDSLTVREWYSEKKISENEYFLVVGRFVPENNYETMIREFMKTNTNKDFVLITNIEKNKFYNKLSRETQFDKDKRIKFVGTVYDQELLKYIRNNSFAYIHGHEVGGTNPSLLEALYSTKLNLLLDVPFNREVAGESAMYWEKDNLKDTIDYSDSLDIEVINNLDELSIEQINNKYTWNNIVRKYESQYRTGQ